MSAIRKGCDHSDLDGVRVRVKLVLLGLESFESLSALVHFDLQVSFVVLWMAKEIAGIQNVSEVRLQKKYIIVETISENDT